MTYGPPPPRPAPMGESSLLRSGLRIPMPPGVRRPRAAPEVPAWHKMGGRMEFSWSEPPSAFIELPGVRRCGAPMPPPLAYDWARDSIRFAHIYPCEFSPMLAKVARWFRSVLRCFVPEPTFLDGLAVARYTAEGMTWKQALAKRGAENTEKLLRWRRGERI